MPRPQFTPGKDPVPIVQDAGWAQGQYEQVRKISPPPGFDLRTVQPVASRYTDYATRPTIKGIYFNKIHSYTGKSHYSVMFRIFTYSVSLWRIQFRLMKEDFNIMSLFF